jgi:FMN phosphatase YigB (HAD superfamily)
MDTFLPSYFGLFADFAAKELGSSEFLPLVLQATQIMAQNVDPTLTNNEVFWEEIQKLIDIDRAQTESQLDVFYRGQFNKLQEVTKPIPSAADLLQTCFDKGYNVVIATNPMFPRVAVEARLRWAGVPVDQFPYNLVTTIENMHATKPHLEYYHEILAKVGSSPQEAIMIGDDWRRDIEPTARLGMFTYWIELPGATLPAAPAPTGYGSLQGLLNRVESGWFDHLAQGT